MDETLARLFAEPDDRALVEALGERLERLAAADGPGSLAPAPRALLLVHHATACVHRGLETLLTDDWFVAAPAAVPEAFATVGLDRAAAWFRQMLALLEDGRSLQRPQQALRRLAPLGDPDRENLFGNDPRRDLEVVRALAAFARARPADFAALPGPFAPPRPGLPVPPPAATLATVTAWLLAAGHEVGAHGGVRLTPDRSDTDATLALLAGFEVAGGLEELDLGRTLVTRRGLESALRLPSLRALDLIATSTDDAACERLATCTTLERLDLSDTAVTDRGAARLAALRQLRHLALERTRIGDRALQRLASLRHLEELRVGESRVTAPAIAALRDALPKCRVFTDDDETDGRDICARR